MHKSISESSKGGTARAQKVSVGWFLLFGGVWSRLMGYFHLPYLLFPWRNRWASAPATNMFSVTKSVPVRAATAPTAAAAGFALRKREGCLGRGDGCQGWCRRGNSNAAPESGPMTCIMSLQLLRLECTGRQPAENLGLRFEAWAFLKCIFTVGVWCRSVFCGHTWRGQRLAKHHLFTYKSVSAPMWETQNEGHRKFWWGM